VREAYLAYLGTILDEEAWERAGRHPRFAPFSLNDQLPLRHRATRAAQFADQAGDSIETPP
jgi:hypothetical protein